MSYERKSDEAIVEGARRFLTSRRERRWTNLGVGVLLLCLCVFYVSAVLCKLDEEPQQMTTGFATGIFLGLIGLFFGLLGAIGVARSVTGFKGHLRSQELLVAYHDRLRDLGALPNDANSEKSPAPSADELHSL